MLDSTMPPDMGAEIRKLSSRIERLEMSARAVNQQRFIQLYPTTGALTPDTSYAPQGAHAYWTDNTSFTNVMAGDFMSDGQYLYGSLFAWVPAGAAMAYEINVREYGATAVTVLTGTAPAGTSSVPITRVLIPDSVFLNPSERRNKFCRIDINIKRTAGAGRVGLGVAQLPYTWPY